MFNPFGMGKAARFCRKLMFRMLRSESDLA